ncbi:YceI family protein [Flavihumibacter rivuli]|uniref:YceI family protein n=1 Tax=Flavihumibacter rivuli TaxID=2838156 RepID=UPI001BDF67FC|nr:YceI family protein [Flavihumibacter rivuli]ULQ57864.1 YceI family protein [Flavihumibacter rivuli]
MTFARNCVLVALLCGMASMALAQEFNLVENRSRVAFSIRNFGFTVDGSIKGLSGKAVFDPSRPEHSVFNAMIEPSTINTGNTMRDGHLRKAEYFDVDQFPKIILRSSTIQAGSKEGTFIFAGLLTIKGVSKPIRFPFFARKQAGGWLFEGGFDLNRRDFGVGGKSLSMADKVTVQLSVFAEE